MRDAKNPNSFTPIKFREKETVRPSKYNLLCKSIQPQKNNLFAEKEH